MEVGKFVKFDKLLTFFIRLLIIINDV